MPMQGTAGERKAQKRETATAQNQLKKRADSHLSVAAVLGGFMAVRNRCFMIIYLSAVAQRCIARWDSPIFPNCETCGDTYARIQQIEYSRLQHQLY